MSRWSISTADRFVAEAVGIMCYSSYLPATNSWSRYGESIGKLQSAAKEMVVVGHDLGSIFIINTDGLTLDGVA